MVIIPAIDLKDSCVVRFVQGKRDKKVYSHNPLKTARHWVSQGAQMLHIVDLDGAFTGKPKNLSIVKEIAKEIEVPIEFGGGIREIGQVRALFDSGVSRIVLGTKAVEDKEFLKEAFKEFRERIIVSVDVESDAILIRGWQASYNGMGLLEFIRGLKEMGFKELIYTDTAKDGTLTGPNLRGIRRLLKVCGLKIIVSGGVSSLDDIRRLKSLEKEGVIGIIIGKALYEGKFTLSEALKLA